MALTRLAMRGDLSQLRWARWQSARSFDAHSLSAYGYWGCEIKARLLLSWLQPLIAHVAATGDEARRTDVAFNIRRGQLEDGACLRDDVLLDHGRAEIVAAVK